MIEEEKLKEIGPYDDSIFQQKMADLVQEPGFLHAISYTMPREEMPPLIEELKKIKTKYDFQHQIMFPFMEMLAKTTTSGITLGGAKYINPALNYTFITNHRDIVLDASFLNLAFLRHGWSTTQVAIGNNLLIYPWITDLVKLNNCFVVKRNSSLREGLENAKVLSAYIHDSILNKKQSVWIAQREGRAKDASDHTQESLVKMLALGGEGSFMESLKEINILPVSISYEYDPNDYLKVREFLLKRRDPNFKKSQRDDLFSMETGILQYKGRVNFAFCPCINPQLESMAENPDKVEVVHRVCAIIDSEIHRNYRIYPVNYIAFDRVEGGNRFASEYSPAEVEAFNSYIESQLGKVDLPDVSAEEREFMRDQIMRMYANPLRNKLAALHPSHV